MSDPKYYDYRQNRMINIDTEGCELVEWKQKFETCPFARHTKGFKIFLSPDKLAANDEYAESDPYNVEKQIDSQFHQRRFGITIDLLQQAEKHLKRPLKILDLGCGEGHITQLMLDRFPTAEVTGLDYAVSAIEYAHEHFPDIDFCVGDATSGPYAQEYFDVVVCNNLWEHVPDPMHLLREMDKFLKPGGFIIVSTPSRYRISNLFRVLLGKPVAFMSEHHVTEYTVGQVIEQFRFGGFQVIEMLSRPISTGSLLGRILRKIINIWINLIKSHHQLEATVFYLAQKPATKTPGRSL
ncbi:class I SAM-dependent methyltransferase [Polystyrenella longa]|nr:class I SAM-dependent methyltransferase [Polystyrenella longa]